MKKITSIDIREALYDHIAERLEVTAGKGSKKKIVISPGLKIEQQNGLMYTISSIEIINKKPYIRAIGGSGNEITISPENFKNYKRIS